MSTVAAEHSVKASLACDIAKILDAVADANAANGLLDMRNPAKNIRFINSILDVISCTDLLFSQRVEETVIHATMPTPASAARAGVRAT